MDEQRQQEQEDQGQRPATEATGELTDADLESAAGASMLKAMRCDE